MEPDQNLPSEKFSYDLRNDTETVIDVSHSVNDFLWKRHPIHSLLLFVLPVCATLAIAYVEFFFMNGFNHDTVQGAIFLALLPLIIPAISYWRVRSRMEKLFYTQLAAVLGFSYSATGDEPKSGQLFTFGSAHNVTNALSGKYRNIPLRLADYSYDIGSGKNRQTYHFIFGELATGGALPEVLCRPAGWSGTLFDTWKPSNARSLSLEGDFNSKFTVYVPQDQEIEALQVLEPDVMVKLMDGFENYGFECIDSHVYLFSKGTMAENRESVLALVSLLKSFCDLLLPELQSFMRKPVGISS